ncbi:UpxY family transcription antiterminator [Psychroflexus sp. ALD_RP9]|uniref:UpxY family transcription antiterminator n=1 Tax=Psychroflexus sp. ALD_RP9 TaxID=2777186 RepID=UPI001A8C7A42|nr:UpxY family transcription antiterminator [Psychroflexus sp. ALD_RP9]QSS97852.1 UpxY family transcription antiterminator [Psychroflexus sp. ALD_RP9]
MTTTLKNWFVIYTKPNAEKKTAQQLEKIGIQVYCPTIKIIKQWTDRKKKVDTPVLPSMLFVYIENHLRDRVFEVPNVVRYLFWEKQPAVISDNEVEILKQSINFKSGFKSHDIKDLKPGYKVDLTEKGFKNIKGTVKYVKDNKCWVIIEPLGYLLKLQT